jgi:hypothetical protein
LSSQGKRKNAHKKAAAWNAAAYESSPACAALPASRTKTVQGGHSQFNFGFVGLATLTPIERNSATDAHKWFKEYMAIANTAGDFSLPESHHMSNSLV